jgi:integrase/recombinase XerD
MDLRISGVYKSSFAFFASKSIIRRRLKGLMSVESGQVIHLPLRPATISPDAVFTDMVDSWRRQQLSRNFRPETISGRERTIRRFADFTGHFGQSTTCEAVDLAGQERAASRLG